MTYKIKFKPNRKYMSEAIGAMLCALALFILLLSTTPDRIGPVGITMFFILLWGFLVSLGLLLRRFLLASPGSGSLLLVIVGSAIAVIMLALGTIQIGWGDIGLSILLLAVFTIYWTKLRES